MGHEAKRPPIVVVGMHRSGTSLLSRLLQERGAFFGLRQDRNGEAAFFRELNDWMLDCCGARWDEPDGFARLEHDPRSAGLIVEYVRRMLSSPRAVSYLGVGRLVRYGSIPGIRTAWGWKDPRTTITWPIWSEIFPEARVVHVLRHGVDVADSLVRRHHAMLGRESERHRHRRGLHWIRPKRSGFTYGVRCATLEGAFSLWVAYVSRARAHLTRLGSHALEVRYEELLRDPRRILESVCRFCGLEGAQPGSDEVAGIRPDRELAYRRDARLRLFARDHAGVLAEMGYPEAEAGETAEGEEAEPE